MNFMGLMGKNLKKANEDIINKLQEITGIKERRYVTDDLNASDLAFLAANQALDGINKEKLEYIIIAQNFAGSVLPAGAVF